MSVPPGTTTQSLWARTSIALPSLESERLAAPAPGIDVSQAKSSLATSDHDVGMTPQLSKPGVGT